MLKNALPICQRMLLIHCSWLFVFFFFQVKCQQCSHCSNTFDPFLDLSLDIVKADSLYKAFANFTAAELLDGGGKEYKCEKCNQKVRALKQLTVYKAPHVLNIHLKRFRAHDPGKIDKKVQFGTTLDMKPFVSGSYVSKFLTFLCYTCYLELEVFYSQFKV